MPKPDLIKAAIAWWDAIKNPPETSMPQIIALAEAVEHVMENPHALVPISEPVKMPDTVVG